MIRKQDRSFYHASCAAHDTSTSYRQQGVEQQKVYTTTTNHMTNILTLTAIAEEIKLRTSLSHSAQLSHKNLPDTQTKISAEHASTYSNNHSPKTKTNTGKQLAIGVRHVRALLPMKDFRKT